ncbi:MAG: sigma-70 family RNA polymerase sigma factor, partial [Pyrinomonadaceae bacterium]
EEAQDLTQETFIKAFRHIDQFREEASLKTWLFRIAINEARNHFRWWKRRHLNLTFRLDDVQNLAEVPPLEEDQLRFQKKKLSDPESQALERERQTIVAHAIQMLGRKYREVVILRDIEGFQYEEISEMLGISLGTVKSRLSRARQELRQKLEDLL